MLGAPTFAGHAGAERLPKFTRRSCRFSAEQGLGVVPAELPNVCTAGLPPRNDGSHVQGHGRLDSQFYVSAEQTSMLTDSDFAQVPS